MVDPVGTGNIPTKPTSEPFDGFHLDNCLPEREALVTATEFPARLKSTVFEDEYRLMMGTSLKFEEFDASVTDPLREQDPWDPQVGDERAVPAQPFPSKEHCTDTHAPLNLQSLPSELHDIEHERLVPTKRFAGSALL